MYLYILESNYDRISVIDGKTAESIVWHKKYNDVGECEIRVICTEELLEIFQEDNYVYRYDDNMFCRITSVDLETNTKDGDYLTIRCKDISFDLSGRIIWDNFVFTGKVCDFIKKLLNDNIINSTQNLRNISNFIIDDSNFDDLTETMTYTTKSDDILQLILNTCNTFNYGFRIAFNIDTKKLIFSLYKGEDKSSIQSEEYVEFSPTYSNIISSKYIRNTINYKNVAIVGSKDSDESLMYIIVYNGDTEPSGKDRKELFIDASSTSRDLTLSELLALFPTATLDGNTYYIIISDVPIAVATVNGDKLIASDYTYDRMLKIIGQNALSERVKTQEFTGEVDIINTYEYKLDYDLGDVVKVINEYGISASAQIIEIWETSDTENPYQIEPKFKYEGGNE